MSRIAPSHKKKREAGECYIRIESTIYTSWNPLSFSCEDDQISRGLNADWFWLDDRGRINLGWVSICGSASGLSFCISFYIVWWLTPPSEMERQSLSMIRLEGIFHAIRLLRPTGSSDSRAPLCSRPLFWGDDVRGIQRGLDGVNDDDRLANGDGIYGHSFRRAP